MTTDRKVVVPKDENRYQNWGRCPICGEEHIITEEGVCSKG